MLDNYNYLIDNLPINEVIDKNDLTCEHIIFKSIIQKDLLINKSSTRKSSIRNSNSTYHLGYEFIMNDNVYILVLLDNYSKSPWTTFDDWDNLDIFFSTEHDLNYIKESKSYIIFHIPMEWFLDEDNLGEMSEYEMDEIRPLIRNWKIDKINTTS